MTWIQSNKSAGHWHNPSCSARPMVVPFGFFRFWGPHMFFSIDFEIHALVNCIPMQSKKNKCEQKAPVQINSFWLQSQSSGASKADHYYQSLLSVITISQSSPNATLSRCAVVRIFLCCCEEVSIYPWLHWQTRTRTYFYFWISGQFIKQYIERKLFAQIFDFLKKKWTFTNGW